MSENLTPANHLTFLQSLTEPELTELVIMPLLEQLGYQDIRYTHGISERGKDVVFVREDQLAGPQFLAATIKCRPLTGSVSSSKSIHEVLFQLQQALREPYISPFNGESVFIETTFCFTPYSIPVTTVESIGAQLRDNSTRVRFIDGPRLLTLIQAHLPDLLISLPDPESRYLHHLCTRFLRATPLGNLGESQKQTVHDLFIPSSISAIEIGEAGYLSFATPDTRESIRQPFTELLKEKKAVVIADVGSGKTTFMQRLVIECANKVRADRNDTGGPLPIFVPLAHFHKSDVSSPATFEGALADFVKCQYGFELHFDSVQQKKLLFLLDGFDELVAKHDVVAHSARSLAERGHDVILTSRPSRIPDLPEYHFFKLNPFTNENVLEFLEKWFSESKGVAVAVNARIQSNPSLADLCRTPLMLTLYAILSTKGDAEALPTRRTDVYSTVVEMLLGRWDSMRKIQNSFSPDSKQQVLEAISYSSHLRQQRWLHGPDLVSLIEGILKARRGRSYSANEAELLFHEIIFRSSLLRPSDTGQGFEFVHLSFQEYFVACALLRKGSIEIVKHLEDDWWRNALRFYFGMCRSLDSILVSLRPKRMRSGFGLRLLEFLSEADYTAPEGRKKVFQMVSRDIVSSAISENELAICRRLGDDVVDALDAIVQDPPKVWSSMNLFRVLLEVSTHKSHKLLTESRQFLVSLNAKETLDVLNLCLVRVPIGGSQEFLLKALEQLDSSLGRVRDRDWRHIRREAEATIQNLRTAMGDATLGRRKREFLKSIANITTHCEMLNNRFQGAS